MPIPFIKNSLFSCLPFISALGESLGLPRTVHLPPNVVEIYFNLLAVKACQLLRCSLISKPTPVSATLLADASPPSHSLRDEFSAFSSERTALSLFLLPRGSLALSRFRVLPLIERASNSTRRYGNLFTSRILSRLYRRRLARSSLSLTTPLDLILKCNDW